MMYPVPLSHLRLSPRDEAELRWYYCESPGEMGLRSSLGLAAGGHLDPDVILERRLEAAHRQRRVRGRLALLRAEDQVTLRAVYGLDAVVTPTTRRTLAPLGILMLVVRDLPETGQLIQGIPGASRTRALARILSQVLKGHARARKKIDQLRFLAELRLIRAVSAYRKAKGNCPKLRRGTPI